MSFTLQKLTEGIRDRHVGQQNKRLVEKWSRTGLLRGMSDVNRENMATLLENQAAQVLRESNTMASGDVGGFTNIAFPIVRRVFGGLVANELVSIQPMSLPSGLLFYLDYTYGNSRGGFEAGQSIYGRPDGNDIQGGADAVGGQYDLVGSGYSRVYKSVHAAANGATDLTASQPILETTDLVDATLTNFGLFDPTDSVHLGLVDHDSQLITKASAVADGGAGQKFAFLPIKLSGFSSALSMDKTAVASVTVKDVKGGQGAAAAASLDSDMQAGSALNLRRLNKLGSIASGVFTADAINGDVVLTLVRIDGTNAAAGFSAVADKNAGGAHTVVEDLEVEFVVADSVTFSGGEADGDPAFESNMASGQESSYTANGPIIPEIDIKIESIPVTAQTRKLRARWSPELAQDLNAYHSMDAEVELTQILSEQIALEIDREILGDLLRGAKGANFFWSRAPGKFVNKRTGAEIARTSTLNPGPAFTGTVREWYETLTETVIDVANEIHRKTLRGSANFIVVSPDVATILEASVLYRPSYSLDGDGQVGAPFTMGAEKIGTLSNRFTVYKDPYFPRNKILVGYKGGSYLETGFVYAPYVPLIVTPTIFQPEDFTPRKGVMTRYGKKMVRADFYGTVTCLDMNVI